MSLTQTKPQPRPPRDAAPVILYVENNFLLRCVVGDVLQLAGWRVQDCSDASTAVARLRLYDHYDLAVIDKELPGLDGLDIVRDARRQSHRERTPIILVALDDCAEEARLAGADAFLRKPQDLLLLVETIRRLLHARRV
jgi:CheY-like chemotaxis protein